MGALFVFNCQKRKKLHFGDGAIVAAQGAAVGDDVSSGEPVCRHVYDRTYADAPHHWYTTLRLRSTTPHYTALHRTTPHRAAPHHTALLP